MWYMDGDAGNGLLRQRRWLGNYIDAQFHVEIKNF